MNRFIIQNSIFGITDSKTMESIEKIKEYYQKGETHMAKIDIERLKQFIECGYSKEEAMKICEAEAAEETKIELELQERERAAKEKEEKEKEEKEKAAKEKADNLTKADIEQMLAEREAAKKSEPEKKESMGELWARK